MRNGVRVLVWLALLLPCAAFAQTNSSNIVTNSTSSSVGATNAVYFFITTSIGPTTLYIGARGLCNLQGPPFPSCTFIGGTGTAANPFNYGCSGNSGPPVTGCSSGTPFILASGQTDINAHTDTQIAGPAGSVAAPIPLDPWVPIGSALGVALLAIGWQLRRRRS